MVFSYYHRLDARRQRLYKLSDTILDLPLARPEVLRGRVLALETSLASGERAAVARDAQALTDALCKEFRVPSVRVEVLERRPAREGSEKEKKSESNKKSETEKIGSREKITNKGEKWRKRKVTKK